MNYILQKWLFHWEATTHICTTDTLQFTIQNLLLIVYLVFKTKFTFLIFKKHFLWPHSEWHFCRNHHEKFGPSKQLLLAVLKTLTFSLKHRQQWANIFSYLDLVTRQSHHTSQGIAHNQLHISSATLRWKKDDKDMQWRDQYFRIYTACITVAWELLQLYLKALPIS